MKWNAEQSAFIRQRIAEEIVIARTFPPPHMFEMMMIMGGVIGFCFRAGIITETDANFLLEQGNARKPH